MTVHAPTLNKSLLKRSVQCQRQLYLYAQQPDKRPALSAADKIAIWNGNRAGEEARKLHPDGILINAPPGAFNELIAQTLNAMRLGALTIFEGAFEHEGVFVRTDILCRDNVKSDWELAEVKATTEHKEGDLNLEDLAIQAYVLQGCGIRIVRYTLMYVDSSKVYTGPHNLFIKKDLTSRILEVSEEIPELIKRAKQTLTQTIPPLDDIGLQCHKPADCPYIDHCRTECHINSPSIFDIPNIRKKKAYDFYKQGIVDIADDRITGLTANQTESLARMRKVQIDSGIWVNRTAARKEILEWTWPAVFLDFETINPCVPWIQGTKPYQQIPFQFSCHTQVAPGKMIASHHEFLWEDITDPRPAFIEALLKAVDTKGTILVYHIAAERTRLRELALDFPQHASEIQAIIDRIVDLEKLIQKYVYAHGFFGSYSMKYVGPAVLGESANYSRLDIGNGLEAQLAFLELINPMTRAAKKADLRKAMLQYCKQDTLLMVLLVNWLLTNHGE